MSMALTALQQEQEQDPKNTSAPEKALFSGEERQSFGETLGRLGLEIAISAEVIQEIADVSSQDQEQFSSFLGELHGLQETTNEISVNISEATTTSSQATAEINESHTTVESARAEITRMIEAANAGEQRMEELSKAIENVGGIINVINSIAKQTNLLALNATIEAARAGEAGKGFSVVAHEVKALASSTSDATTQIEETLEEIKNGFELLKTSSQETSFTARHVGEKTETFSCILNNVSGAMSTIDRKIGIIDQQMEVVNEACEGFISISEGVSTNLKQSSEKLSSSARTMRSVSDDTDKMVLRNAQTGGNQEEYEIIQNATYASQKLTELIEAGLAAGQVTMDDLFDRNHEEIPGSNPVQYLAKHSRFMDEIAQPLIEEIIASNDRITFCTPIDDTAYVSTNSLAVSKPQGDDPVWNMANCRHHRYYLDRTCKRAGLNQKPLLLQTYRRDMGGGVFVSMKDVSAPIFIKGRHWGGFRVGYKPGE